MHVPKDVENEEIRDTILHQNNLSHVEVPVLNIKFTKRTFEESRHVIVGRSCLYDALKSCIIAPTVRVRGYSPLLFTERYFGLLVNPYPLHQLPPLGLSFGDWLGIWRFVLGGVNVLVERFKGYRKDLYSNCRRSRSCPLRSREPWSAWRRNWQVAWRASAYGEEVSADATGVAGRVGTGRLDGPEKVWQVSLVSKRYE